jgi:hypothetical protein
MLNYDFFNGLLAEEADRIEEDCTYSAKGHYESARIWGRWNLGIGLPAAVIAAGAGFSGFSGMPELAGALAVLSGTLTSILTFLKPSERSSAHLKAGAQYNSLKNRARLYKNVELPSGKTSRVLVRRVQQLSEDRNSLNEASPEILRPGFIRARHGIESGQSQYRVDRKAT